METAYFGVYLWKQAVEAAGGADLEPLREAMRRQTVEAPEGPVRIDPATQHAWRVARIGRVTPELEFETVWQSPGPLAPQPFPPSRTPDAWRKMLDGLFAEWGGRWERHAH
jgi:urea transport system substrate-binding protein